MIKTGIELLIEQLAKQIDHAHSMDGAWGEEITKARRAACDAANSTIAMLEALGIDGEEATERAEAKLYSFQRSDIHPICKI